MESRTIRSKFLDYFAAHQHERVRSGSLVPANDPTLYFTNAGMVPFKDVFVGAETRPYRRACSSQKCLRVSGKHNDLEAVGRTPKHHTFFEMLGNFSFGDYFKREAIVLAWRFLCDEIGLAAERMVATVFGGEASVPADEEAYAIWRDEVGLPPERIFRLGSADNFWSMGETGPCGPCSEIHLLPDANVPMDEALRAGGPAVDDRWVEVWNLVFMQFNRQTTGELSPLKQTGVDTGMGLERLSALANGLSSTYETDLLRPLIAAAERLSGQRYGDDEERDVSLRVLADHARATAFCIADGVFPEKGGREYVLRRIMRRAIRHGKLLGVDDLFFPQLCLEVVSLMGEDYPELRERADVIEKIVSAEESAFRRTLDRGLQKLQHAVEQAKRAGRDTLSESFVGDLYATDGFPVDLTRLIADESNLSVDERAALQWVQRTHGAGDTKVGGEAIAEIYKQLSEREGPTEFAGYGSEQCTSKVVALLRNGSAVEHVDVGEEVELVTSRTSFYGRAGGQVGDTGKVIGPEGSLTVEDTLKPDGALIVHRGRVESGTIAVGQQVELAVDGARRQAIRLNHSATHLLHHALRQVLGPHVAQKGSEVAPQQLRFDFSHFEPMTEEQIEEVERRVNEEIRTNQPSQTDETDFESAREAGAMALFGEKYGDRVRVVRIGSQSVELCGGTHVARAGDIGLFRIISEEALAMGVRRIVAATGAGALAYDQSQQQQLRAAARSLKVGPSDLADRIVKLQEQLKLRERELADLRRQVATGSGPGTAAHQVETVDGIKVLVSRAPTGDPKTLRDAGDTLRDKLGSGLVVLGAEHEGKARLLVMVSKDLTDRLHAGKLVGQLAPLIGGKGGGRPDMAQAGGPGVDGLEAALARAPELVRQASAPDAPA
jgi:alanyl-tRNA synthetase